MAWVKRSIREIDHHFNVENAIRQMLESRMRAAVEISTIRNEYVEYDDDGYIIPQTLEEQCEELADVVGATYTIVPEDDKVLFHQKE